MSEWPRGHMERRDLGLKSHSNDQRSEGSNLRFLSWYSCALSVHYGRSRPFMTIWAYFVPWKCNSTVARSETRLTEGSKVPGSMHILSWKLIRHKIFSTVIFPFHWFRTVVSYRRMYGRLLLVHRLRQHLYVYVNWPSRHIIAVYRGRKAKQNPNNTKKKISFLFCLLSQ